MAALIFFALIPSILGLGLIFFLYFSIKYAVTGESSFKFIEDVNHWLDNLSDGMKIFMLIVMIIVAGYVIFASLECFGNFKFFVGDPDGDGFTFSISESYGRYKISDVSRLYSDNQILKLIWNDIILPILAVTITIYLGWLIFLIGSIVRLIKAIFL